MKPVAKVLHHRLLHLHIIIARTVGVVNDGFRKRCNDWSVIMYNLVNSWLWPSFSDTDWSSHRLNISTFTIPKDLLYCILVCVFLNFLVLFSAKLPIRKRQEYLQFLGLSLTYSFKNTVSKKWNTCFVQAWLNFLFWLESMNYTVHTFAMK